MKSRSMVMTTQKMVAKIRQHEKICSHPGGFRIAEICRIAKGILAVRDNESEFTAYYDKKLYRIKIGSPFTDESRSIKGFPVGVGFVADIMARTWYDITRSAQIALRPVDNSTMTMYEHPIKVSLKKHK